MIKTLARHGNSLALVIDKAVLDLLNIRDDTPLEISTDGNVLVVTPLRNDERKQKFEDALQSVNARYSRTLKRLAE